MLKKLLKICLFGFLALFAYGRYLDATMSPEERAAREEKRKADAIKEAASRPPPPPPPAILRVKLDKTDCSISGFGVVAVCSFTISNGNDYDIADPVVECVFSGGSGTVLASHSTTIYERVRSGQKIRSKKLSVGFVNGQAANYRCTVTQVSQ